MRRLSPKGLVLNGLAAFLPLFLLACSGNDTPGPTATPDAAGGLALEIAQAYGELMREARLLVEPRPPAPEAKQLLHNLREEYRVQFANFACLLDTLDADTAAAVAAAFDAERETLLPEDMAWLQDAASDYDFEDAAIRPILEDILTLDDYAFLDRVAASRPGEELLCG